MNKLIEDEDVSKRNHIQLFEFSSTVPKYSVIQYIIQYGMTYVSLINSNN